MKRKMEKELEKSRKRIEKEEIKWMNKHFTNYMMVVNGENYLPEVKESLKSVIKKAQKDTFKIIKENGKR